MIVLGCMCPGPSNNYLLYRQTVSGAVHPGDQPNKYITCTIMIYAVEIIIVNQELWIAALI